MSGMSHRGVWALGILTAVALGVTARAQNLPPSFADVVERVAPAVVNISTTRRVRDRLPRPQFPPGSPFEEFFRDFFDGDEDPGARRTFSLGSGFIVDPRGYVVTNNHVIEGADEITVVMHDETRHSARVVGRDPKTDLAVLEIEAEGPFPYVEWADSDRVRVGDWMIAIGNPFGLGTSVTAGIVSARGRDIRAGPYDDFFQVDAAINRGNSGGPSFTLEGKVFGVNTAIFSPSGTNIGIGFAIPSNLARRVVTSLIEKGRVVRAWIGVRIQQVTPEIAESLGLDGARGALVAAVVPGGPAATAGIRQGDVILAFGARPIRQMRELPRVVAESVVGRPVPVTVWRRGETLEVTVTPAELPPDEELARLAAPPAPAGPRAQASLPDLGLTVATLDEALRARFRLDEKAEGVVVTEVAPDGLAARAGLRPGDRVLEIDSEEVRTPADVVARLETARGEGRASVLLLVERQGEARFVPLRLAD